MFGSNGFESDVNIGFSCFIRPKLLRVSFSVAIEMPQIGDTLLGYCLQGILFW